MSLIFFYTTWICQNLFIDYCFTESTFPIDFKNTPVYQSYKKTVKLENLTVDYSSPCWIFQNIWKTLTWPNVYLSRWLFSQIPVQLLKGYNARHYLLVMTKKMRDAGDCNGTRTHDQLICKRTLKYFVKLAKWLSCVVSTYLYGMLLCVFIMSHTRLEWIRKCNCPNVKGLFARSRYNIWSLSVCRETWTYNHSTI